MAVKPQTTTLGDGEQLVTAGGAHVLTPADVPGYIYAFEIASISNTRYSISLPSGLEAVEITLFPTAAASVYDILDVCFNAATDGDADTKLGAIGSRCPVPAGFTLPQYVPEGGALITRIDLKLRAAASGANLVVIYGRMPA